MPLRFPPFAGFSLATWWRPFGASPRPHAVLPRSNVRPVGAVRTGPASSGSGGAPPIPSLPWLEEDTCLLAPGVSRHGARTRRTKSGWWPVCQTGRCRWPVPGRDPIGAKNVNPLGGRQGSVVAQPEPRDIGKSRTCCTDGSLSTANENQTIEKTHDKSVQ